MVEKRTLLFNEELHKYTLDGMPCTSVTQKIELVSPKFDTEYWAKMKTFRVEEIIDVFNKKKYKINTLPYEVNLFGIRNPDNTSNGFNDCVGLFYKDANNKWIIEQYVATTDAGLFYRLNPITPEGTAILVPGQYLDCYKIGLHKGYQAL